MKILYFIINDNDLIGTIYESEKYGRVIVFRTNIINLEKEITIYSIDGGDGAKNDMLELVMSVLPK